MNPILLSPRKGSIVTDKKKLSSCFINFELIDEKKIEKIRYFSIQK